MGYTGTSLARQSLLPYLESVNTLERWASALGLGRMHDERALPVLFRMLIEFRPAVPPSESKGFYNDWSYEVPRILAGWGTPGAVPALRHALREMVQMELTIPEPPPEEKRISPRDDWQRYEDEIVYALGRLGAFGALTGLTEPEARLSLWRIHLIMGHLQGRFQVAELLRWSRYPEIQEEVDRLLERCFGLTIQEREQDLKRYEMTMAAWVTHLYQRDPLHAWDGSVETGENTQSVGGAG